MNVFFSVDLKVHVLKPNTIKMPPRNVDIDPTALVNGEDGFPSVQQVVTPESMETKRPPMRIVWRNVLAMAYLHTAALYGIYCIFYCKPATLLWGKFVNVSSGFRIDCTGLD